jgi:hypothetical protein
MKRIHRTWHRRVWFLLTPVAAAVITWALLSRADAAANADWPAWLATPAPSAGG